MTEQAARHSQGAIDPAQAFKRAARLKRMLARPGITEESKTTAEEKLLSLAHTMDPKRMGSTEILKAIQRGDLPDTEVMRSLVRMVVCRALRTAGTPGKSWLFKPVKERPSERGRIENDAAEVWPNDPETAKAGVYQIIEAEEYMVPDDFYDEGLFEPLAPVLKEDKSKKPKN